MKVLVSGATGMIGSTTAEQLEKSGHSVLRLTRNPKQAADVGWNPDRKEIDADKLDGVEAVLHLAGENIGTGRWTDAKKRRIRDSRVQGTAFLAETLGNSPTPPKSFVCASAIGIYGSRGDEVLREDSAPGTGFLAEVCRDWEAAANAVSSANVRVALARFGVVLSTRGGALKEMLLPFKIGVGGVLGSGKQYFSWIALDDAVGALLHLLTIDSAGPFNVVAPNPATNKEFTKALGKALHRPTVAPMPAFAARLAFGKEKADELLLGSTRVEPARLLETGYAFQYPRLQEALEHVLSQ